ncbi:hypothetical protein HNV11_16375 [Spirosoma taeanense]|uniref:histidine kinase n=1 Tax=Spirosoma taeanense TaxID=2735870 RepID=A0A6M5YC14_9BACT|nr:sensor histidine kinase [Spirosoma taeanense]QJW90840.1 hypothetical protein HNV11_16375 [Spirosoma taeanense]
MLYLLLYALPIQAQNFTFNRVPLFEENIRGFITAMAQDDHGYMWFTGVNLYRYDGYHLITYRNDPRDSTSIAPSRLESIYIGKNGIIWIGTFGSGLERFDPATGIFTHYPNKPHDPGSLSNNIVTSILEDQDGLLWVGTHGGLNRFDPKTGKFRRYQHNPADPTSLSNDQVRILYQDRQGTLWIGCGSPFGNESPGEAGGLNRLDKNTGLFTRYLHDPRDPNSLLDNKVRAICEDSRGNFWIGTAGDGLHQMNRQTGRFTRFRYDPLQPDKLSAPEKKGDFHHVTFVHEDVTGGIWIGAFPSGLNYFDPKTSKITRYVANKDKPEGLQENSVWYAYTSRDGVLWISTQFYVYRIDPLRPHVTHITTDGRVNAFYEDHRTLWIGTDKGLLRSDLNSSSATSFRHDPQRTSSLSSDVVLSLWKDRKGNLWAGTANGLNRFNPQTETFTRYEHNRADASSISQGGVLSLYEDHLGDFWIGTDSGLDRMDRVQERFTHYRHKPGEGGSLSNNTVKCINEDQSGTLWIGTWSRGGINRLDRRAGRFRRYLEGSNVVNIAQDAQGTLWVATEFGLFRRNDKQDLFTRFTDAGPELSTANIVSILEDSKRNLWLGSVSGIFRLNASRASAQVYGKKYGILPNGLSDMVGHKRPDGALLFGDETGYYVFHPGEIKTNTKAPQVLITDFKIADMPVKPGPDSPLKKPIEETRAIELTIKQNVFSFEFSGIHYSSPEANKHLFILENYEKNWRRAGSEKAAYYSNVPPGNYVFRVKAASSDGLWAENALRVTVLPPWWATWWAYGLYAILFMGGVYGVHRFQKQRVIAIERERTRERELAQAKKIEQAYTELKTTQTQLIQSEKMASLGELTAGIAHEMQNPLNFVNNFAEVSTELVDELKEGPIQKLPDADKQYADEILIDLSRNLAKITNHGQRAASIVNGMLEHTRMGTGERRLTDLNTLCDEYLHLAYHGLLAKDKTFSTKLETDFEADLGLVDVVPQELGRVLLNLYNNAFYAVSEKKQQSAVAYQPIVRVSTRRVEDTIEIQVLDNGIGIPDAVKAKIFQPFFTTKPTGEGTGLGLSLSYDIVTKGHGGSLLVESQAGQGTQFVIQLPQPQVIKKT